MQGYRSILTGSLAVAATLALAACAHHAPPPAASPVASAPATATAPPPAPSTAPLPVKKAVSVRYVVKKGDTLWSIASHFYANPWLWPEVWYENRYIRDPHLIYPGDVITLSGGVLTIARGGTVVRSTEPFRQLKPTIQRTPLAQAVPTIPYDDISDLLSHPRVMTLDQYNRAPYILQPVGGQLLIAAPSSAYIRGDELKHAGVGTTYAVVKKEKPLYAPRNHELLGYEVLYLGRGHITAIGDPATFKLTASTQEIRPGDRLAPVETGTVSAQFPLLTPNAPIKGQIIDVIGGLGEVGQYQVVVLDLGANNGLQRGDVLAVKHTGARIIDPYAQTGMRSEVQLPDRRIGQVVVFRVFPRVSYALVMRATHPVRIGNTVTNP